MSFLTAEWRKLIIANYVVDENELQRYLPYGTEIDKWNGLTYISLVGFMFKETKLLGVKIPFHINFEEVNLRFYVRRKEGDNWKRGVVFIKEIVPRKAITFIANLLYNENYVTLPMNHLWVENEKERSVEYEWKYKKQKQNFKVVSERSRLDIKEGSEEEFITEHYWGYTKVNSRTTYEYEVTHPQWQYYPIKSFEINVDFALVYGNLFKTLNDIQPKSIMLMEGSGITVENKSKLKMS